MRPLPALLLALTFALPAGALADARLECIARCETPASQCMGAAHTVRDQCVVGVRQTCRARPPAEQFNCLVITQRPCASARISQLNACRATFNACHAACGARPAATVEYWCSLDFDGPGGRTYHEWFCPAARPGENPREHCMALLKDAPAMGYSLTCDPVQ